MGAAQAVVLHPDGTVNTAGNRLHYLGFSWAPNGDVPPSGPPAEVTVGSGACLLVPARRFREVGGFWEAMFLYCEDTDLCWRLRLAGLRILVCPEARVRHDYDFSRHASKHYHLERNRLMMLAANYELSTIARLAPALVGTELALLAVAVREGWLPQKLQALSSAARSLPAVREQRRAVSLLRRIPDSGFSRRLERRLGPEFGAGIARMSAPLLEGVCPPRPPLVGLGAAPPGRLCAHDQARPTGRPARRRRLRACARAQALPRALDPPGPARDGQRGRRAARAGRGPRLPNRPQGPPWQRPPRRRAPRASLPACRRRARRR